MPSLIIKRLVQFFGIGLFLLGGVFAQPVSAMTTPAFIASYTDSGGPSLMFTSDIAVDSSGNIYVVDELNHQIIKMDSSGNFVTSWGSEGTANGQFEFPYGIAIGPSGTVYITDLVNNRIQAFTTAGVFIRKWGRNGGDGSSGTGNGEFNFPTGITTDSAGNVYVVDQTNNRVQTFDASGNFLARFGKNGGDGSSGSGDGQFNSPAGIAVAANGDIYIMDTANDRIQVLASNGTFLRKWSYPTVGIFASHAFGFSQGIELDTDTSVYVAEGANHWISVSDSAGNNLLKFGRNGGDGTTGSGDGEFNSPVGIAIDTTHRTLYVLDSNNARVQKFSLPPTIPDAAPTTTAQAATSITATTAVLNGTITDTGSVTTTIRGQLRTHAQHAYHDHRIERSVQYWRLQYHRLRPELR